MERRGRSPPLCWHCRAPGRPCLSPEHSADAGHTVTTRRRGQLEGLSPPRLGDAPAAPPPRCPAGTTPAALPSGPADRGLPKTSRRQGPSGAPRPPAPAAAPVQRARDAAHRCTPAPRLHWATREPLGPAERPPVPLTVSVPEGCGPALGPPMTPRKKFMAAPLAQLNPRPPDLSPGPAASPRDGSGRRACAATWRVRGWW